MAVVKRFRYLTHPKAPLAGTGVNLDIDGWLRGIGLGQYIELFRANDVDGEVLPKLTADDLISMGVTSVGHRRKLLQAIAALGAEVAATAHAGVPRARRDHARGESAPGARGRGALQFAGQAHRADREHL